MIFSGDTALIGNILHGSPEAIIIADAQTGMIVDANERACTWLGRSVESLRKLYQTELHPPSLEEQSRGNFKNHAQNDPTKPLYDELLAADGSRRPVEVIASKIDINGRDYLVGWFRDITDRPLPQGIDEAERFTDAITSVIARLGEPQTELEDCYHFITACVAKACHVAHTSIWFLDDHGQSMICASLHERGQQQERGRLAATDYPAYFAALNDQRAIDAHDAMADPRTIEFCDGNLKPLGISSMLDAQIRIDGKLVGVLCLEHIGRPRHWTAADVSFAASVSDQLSLHLANYRSQQLVDQLAASENHFRTTLVSIGDGVITCSNDWHVTSLNPVACCMLQCDEATSIGQRLNDLLSLTDPMTKEPIIDRCLGENGEWIDHNSGLPILGTMQNDKGNDHQITISCTPIRQENDQQASGNILILTDVTKQVLMEERLRQSQKMDAVGQLAGGVAHDFNNMLGGILGAAELLERNLDAHERQQKLVHTIVTAASRASELTNKLLSFSRKSTMHLQQVNMHDVITDAIDLFSGSASVHITVELEEKAHCNYVKGDPSALQNTILNLVINARDAMSEDPSGSLRIKTRKIIRAAAEKPTSEFNLEPGNYIEIEISDTGCGIPYDIQSRIFEPFYTTKAIGSGTGLGLSAVYGVISEHQGSIDLRSTPQVGTTFTLLLPTSSEPTEHLIPNETSPIPQDLCVLFIDDEPTIRTTAELTLAELGHQTLLAKDGQEGFDIWNAQQEQIDLIILDAVMPRMSGPELIQHIRHDSQRIPIIMVSGFTAERYSGCADDIGPNVFLKKPYTHRELVAAIKEALGNILT